MLARQRADGGGLCRVDEGLVLSDYRIQTECIWSIFAGVMELDGRGIRYVLTVLAVAKDYSVVFIL